MNNIINDKNMTRQIIVTALVLLSFCGVRAQEIAVKTNALYWATTTPNIGVEASVGKKHTVQLFYGLNPWKQSGGDQTSSRHWLLMPEWRYWFCESFNGWFIGAHLMGGQFNVGSLDLPLAGFLDDIDDRVAQLKDHRYEGWYAGGGVTVGYQWMLSKHWNFEASLGIGYDYIKFDKYKCGACGEKVRSSHANYVGPTKAALSVLYIF